MRQGLVKWGLLILLALMAIATPAGLSSLSLSLSSPAWDLDLGIGGRVEENGRYPAIMPMAVAEPSSGLPGPAERPRTSEAEAEAEPMPHGREPRADGDREAATLLTGELGLEPAGVGLALGQPEKPFYVPGKIVTLKPDPDASFEVAANGSLKFTAILVNQGKEGLRLTGELIVIKGDGTMETLLAPRALRLKAGQRLQLPVELAVQAWGLPPGEVEFLAILRDLQGAIVDKASISFRITLPLEHQD
jgi:hypothetical protein